MGSAGNDGGCKDDCKHLSAGGAAVDERDASHEYVVGASILVEGIYGCDGED